MFQTFIKQLNEFSKIDFGNYFTFRAIKLGRIDFILSILVALCAIIFYMFLIKFSENAAAAMSMSPNTWFQSDGLRVFRDMTKFDADHYRDGVHPLFSIFSIPITNSISYILNLSSLQSVNFYNAILFAISSSILYIVVRSIGCNVLDSLMLVTLFVTSAASIFWFTIPETYPLGCVSIICCLLVLAKNPKRDCYFIGAGVLSLGVTVTNWSAALIASAASRSPRRFVIISIISLVLVACGSLVARAVFPHPGYPFFLLKGLLWEKEYVGHSYSGSAMDRLGGEFISPLIAPTLAQPTSTMLSFQATIPQTVLGGDLPYIIALGALLVILVAAVLEIIKHPDRFSISLCAILSGQAILHLFYGEETFLYALHFAPLLVVVCAHAFRTSANAVTRAAMIILIISGTYNNVGRFFNAVSVPIEGADEILHRIDS